MTSYPTVDEVIAVHAQLIARFGGSLGIRDRGALESALARPRSGYYDDFIQEAAALWESLSQNHPFVDGNKRVAATWTATDSYQVNYQLAELEAALAPSFFRARRSVLVNLGRVKEIRPYFKSSFLLAMPDAAEIAVSERQAKLLRQRIPGL